MCRQAAGWSGVDPNPNTSPSPSPRPNPNPSPSPSPSPSLSPSPSPDPNPNPNPYPYPEPLALSRQLDGPHRPRRGGRRRSKAARGGPHRRVPWGTIRAAYVRLPTRGRWLPECSELAQADMSSLASSACERRMVHALAARPIRAALGRAPQAAPTSHHSASSLHSGGTLTLTQAAP